MTDGKIKDMNAETDKIIADSPREIRSQIEDTRQNMGETIDKIQEKLSVSNITEQVKDEMSEQISDAWKATKESVVDATVIKTGEIMEYVSKGLEEVSGTQVGRAARKNPFAVTLIGAGLGMLLYNAFQGKNSQDDRFRRTKRGLSSMEDRSALQNAKGKAGQAYDSVSKSAGTAYKSAANAAGDAYDAAGDAYDSAGNLVKTTYDAAGNAVGKTYDAAGNVINSTYTTAQELASKAQGRYDYYIEENPLAVGAVALAVGAAVGLSIPSSSFESNLMGETRDNLVGQATDQVSNFIGKAENTVQEKIEQVKTVANKTVDTAVKETKNVADKTFKKAKDEADKQNLT